MLTTIPTKSEKKVHKLPIILKKFNFFQILKKQKRRHIMASKASKKIIFLDENSLKVPKKSHKSDIKVIY
jgi:hypothetical protein